MSENAGRLTSDSEIEAINDKLDEITQYALKPYINSDVPYIQFQSSKASESFPKILTTMPFPLVKFRKRVADKTSQTLYISQTYQSNSGADTIEYNSTSVTIPAKLEPQGFSRQDNKLWFKFFNPDWFDPLTPGHDREASTLAFSIDGITTPTDIAKLHNYNKHIASLSTIGHTIADGQFHTIRDVDQAMNMTMDDILNTYKFEVAIRVNLPQGFEGNVTLVLSDYVDEDGKRSPLLPTRPQDPVNNDDYMFYDSVYVKGSRFAVLHINARGILQNHYWVTPLDPERGNQMTSLNLAVTPTNGQTYTEQLYYNSRGDVYLLNQYFV